MNSTSQVRRHGFRQFGVGIALYVAIVIASGFLVEPETLPTVFGIVLVALPMAAAVWGMAGWLRAIRTFDELQQKMFAEAGLIALGLTALVTFTYGFLQALVGLPHVSMFVVFPFISFTFALALPFTQRRYS